MAQLNDANETATFHFDDAPNDIYAIDTGIIGLEHYNFLLRDGWDYMPLGNVGLAHRSLAYQSFSNLGFQSGMRNFDAYKYSLDRLKRYHTKKPLSEIRYSIGSKLENIFGASHAQNINNRFDYGLDFDRIRSRGSFDRQETRNASFNLYGTYSSSDDRYHLDLQLNGSFVKVQENGGLVEDLLSDSTASLFAPQLYEVRVSNALTQHSTIKARIVNSYDWGFHRLDSINDTLQVKFFYPKWRVSHTTGTNKNTFQYNDSDPDSLNYETFYQNSDSLYYRLYYHEIPNEIAFEYLGAVDADSVYYRNLQARVALQHDNIELWQNRMEMTTNNLHTSVQVSSNAFSGKPWGYNAEAKFYLTGYNQGDFSLIGSMDYTIANGMRFGAGGSHVSISPSYIENAYFSSSELWQNDFNNKQITEIYGQLDWQKQQLKLRADYKVLQQHIYFQDSNNPVQVNEAIQYWRIDASKKLRYKIWHWDNFVGVQGSSNSDVLRLPSLYWNSKAYVQGKIFKGNMLALLGIDMRYNSNFTVDGWNPVTGQFYQQNELFSPSIPIFDVFLNFKVNTLRVFVRSNYLSQGLFARNYLAALNYPDRGRSFAGGLRWRFLE